MRTFIRPVLLTLSCCLLMEAVGQGFNRRYDVQGILDDESAFSVEPLDDGGAIILSAAKYADSLTQIVYASVVTVLRIDDSGMPVDTNQFFEPYHVTYPGIRNSLFKLPTGGFAAGGSITDTTYTTIPVLFLLDSVGVPLGMIEYPVNDTIGEFWVGRQACATSDGGAAIVGITSGPSLTGDPFLLKLDSSWNMEWIHVYGDTLLAERARSVIPGPNGSVYVGGVRYTSTDWLPFMMHIDSAGTLLWDIEYNEPDIQELVRLANHQNGNIVMASSWRTPAQAFYPDHVGLRLVDANGSVIWSKQYGEANGESADLISPKTLDNGDIVAAGYGWIDNYNQGTILKVNAQGDSLWMRHYHYYDSLWTRGVGFLRDIAPLPDGGFMAVGTASGQSNNPNDYTLAQYSQDSWVVRVDSMGCILPGCDSLSTSITEQVSNLNHVLKVFPNPISTGETLTVQIDVPASLRDQPLILNVINNLGQLVYARELPSNANEHIIDGFEFRGVGYVHLVSGSTWLGGTKVVVH